MWRGLGAKGALRSTASGLGLELVYNNDTRKQGLFKLIKNFTYTIRALSDTELTLTELGNEAHAFRLPIGSVRKWFTYSHASTGHTSQGARDLCFVDRSI